MIHLGRLSLAGTGIVVGGVLLGSALASFAHPLPKASEPAPWEATLHPRIAVGEVREAEPSLPEDLYPASLPSSYAPEIAFSELRWAADVRTPQPDDDVSAPLRGLDSEREPFADPAPFDQRPIAVAHYVAIEQAARNAATAAAVGASLDAPIDPGADPAAVTVRIDPAAPPPLPQDAGEARVIHIADTGA